MTATTSIFFDFNLPNATTWFYFSFFLAVTLFFKFSRILSLRNLDVLTIFLLAPGLLLFQQARQKSRQVPALDPQEIGTLVLEGASPGGGAALRVSTAAQVAAVDQQRAPWYAYLLLLGGSAYLMIRCIVDLALVRRPTLAPNLSMGGLIWLGGVLFLALALVAFRPIEEGSVAATSQPSVIPNDSEEVVGQPTAAVQLARESLQFSDYLERAFAVLCHLSVVAGLVVFGHLHFRNLQSGLAAATLYLLLPYTGYFVNQLHHVWPMAFLIWAFVLYRQPWLAGAFFGLAAGTAFFPILLLPIWISFYWKRGSLRFLASAFLTAGLALAATGIVLWSTGRLEVIIDSTLALPDWQPWKLRSPTQESIWTGIHWAYRLPVSILYLFFVIVTAFWPNPKNLAHTIALSAVVLIGMQFWYADRGGIYILWYLPLFLLLMFRPDLSSRRPPPVPPINGRWAHWWRKMQEVKGRLAPSRPA